ncbi:hypothetical protein Fmac_010576 [Flemingia macrophylla]|uniref:Uncharacterized protein n=1 Tax=Flemingia macrophylla TaxID=520843 RepID=A0ABD1MK11_9FABA
MQLMFIRVSDENELIEPVFPFFPRFVGTDYYLQKPPLEGSGLFTQRESVQVRTMLKSLVLVCGDNQWFYRWLNISENEAPGGEQRSGHGGLSRRNCEVRSQVGILIQLRSSTAFCSAADVHEFRRGCGEFGHGGCVSCGASEWSFLKAQRPNGNSISESTKGKKTPPKQEQAETLKHCKIVKSVLISLITDYDFKRTALKLRTLCLRQLPPLAQQNTKMEHPSTPASSSGSNSDLNIPENLIYRTIHEVEVTRKNLVSYEMKSENRFNTT